uniref:Uncharacterized protein n=1 Tax=Ignisphaera aggregans TaxID=334771 RepID=A0A7J3Z613_9CREN
MQVKQIRSAHGVEKLVSVVARPVTVYPGGSAESVVYIDGHGVRVFLSATSSDSCIQVLDVAPVTGVIPLQVKVVIAVSATAKPGVYSIDVTIIDTRQGKAIASVKIPVYVLSSQALTGIVSDIEKLRELYKEKGIQYAVIQALSRVSTGLRFSDIKFLYELIEERRVSNGSVGDLLKRLLKKGILKHVRGFYYLVVDLRCARSVMDLKRARNGLKGAHAYLNRNPGKVHYEQGTSREVPQPIEKALKIVEKLVKEDYWVAVDFVAHVLVGIRKTGTWVLWFEDYFIYHENKTNFFHYIRSPKLSDILRELGLKPGVMMEHKNHSSEKYVIELYGSYANARRIHYLMKELGWFMYGEPLLLELSKDYFSLRELASGKVLLEHSGGGNHDNIFRVIVYPGEHIDEDNEETYFYRPSRLY